ncbi:MAG: MATE family efflux transporter [Spirochaetaceae bacterium]|nr:MATE family efflux transporter [Spirochaetaceae bacterium]
MKLKGFYSSLVAIAIPISLQALLQNFVNMLDTIMIGRLGSVEIAAVGLGNQIFFILNMILFGITSGGGVFIAQFWGKKDLAGIRKSLGLMTLIAFVVSFIFTIVCLLIPNQLIRLYSPDPQVIQVGGAYLRFVCLSYVPTAISFSITLALRSTERVKLPLVCTSISLFTNLIANYLLIFVAGLGVKGAAIATVISRIIELVILATWSYSHKYEICGKLKELLGFNRYFIVKFLKIAFPVIINETFWGLGTSVYNAIFAHAGTNSFTAYSITGTISQLTWVFCMGFGNGVGVLIGKRIGEKKIDEAKTYAKRSMWFMPLIGAFVGVFLVPLSKLLPVFFNVDQEIIKTATAILMILIFVYPFNSFCMNWIVGVCRAGGDTVFSAVAEIVVLWCVAIPLGYVAAFVLHLPAPMIYLFFCSESIVKAIIGAIRVLSGKWLHEVT